MIKDIDVQSDKEIYRVRSAKICSTGTSVPMEVRGVILLVGGCVYQPESSPTQCHWDFYGGFLLFSSVQSLSRVWLFATSWIVEHQVSLSITNSQSLLKLMPIKSVMPSSHLILWHLLLLMLPVPPSIRVFSSESTLCMRWPKYWSFSFSISPSNEHQGLIPFKMDWLDLLAVQGTLKSLLQHHSSKASILQHSLSSQSNSHIHTWLLEKP